MDRSFYLAIIHEVRSYTKHWEKEILVSCLSVSSLSLAIVSVKFLDGRRKTGLLFGPEFCRYLFQKTDKRKNET